MAVSYSRVSPTASFPAAGSPSVAFPFTPKNWVVVNEDTTAANYVEVSLDGTNVIARLVPGVLAGLKFDQQITKIWLRAGAGTPAVQVIAEE